MAGGGFAARPPLTRDSKGGGIAALWAFVGTEKMRRASNLQILLAEEGRQSFGHGEHSRSHALMNASVPQPPCPPWWSSGTHQQHHDEHLHWDRH